MARNGVPTSLDYLLGRGELFLSQDLDSSGRPKGFRTLGNAEAFTVTVEAETLEHFSSLQGLKVKDREVTLSQAMNLAFQLTEIDVDNLTIFLSGDNADIAQTGASITTIASDDNLKDVEPGQWFDLYDVQAPTEYPPITGDRTYRISAVSVFDTTKGTTYTEGTDYEVDAELGRIFIIVGGGISSGDELCVDFTYATLTISEVRAMTTASFGGVMKFISRNANQSGQGSEVEYTFWQVSLTADGDFALIGDEWATLNIAGVAEQNAAISANSPTCTVRRLSV
jgi:hypothetical protein